MVRAAQHGQARVMIRYSVTHGGGGGATSVTCRRAVPVTGAPDRSAPQPAQLPGSQMMVSFGSSTSGIAEPGAPRCLPGLRPEERREERRSGLR